VTHLTPDDAPSPHLARGRHDCHEGFRLVTRPLVVGREDADITLALLALPAVATGDPAHA